MTQTADSARLRDLTYAVALAIMVGWLLYIGRGILMPVAMGVISAYLLTGASDLLGRLPLLDKTPAWLRQMLALCVFAFVVWVLAKLIIGGASTVAASLPTYEKNLAAAFAALADRFGVDGFNDWAALREMTLARVNLQQTLTSILASTAGFGSQLFLVIMYAAFILLERGGFAAKMARVMGGTAQAQAPLGMLAEINAQVGRYLAVKTIINVILALISWGVMISMGVELASFWAVLIGVVNYIPYFGALAAVVCPALLHLAQTGSPEYALLLLLLLSVPHVLFGYVFEPRMIGRSVNLSPLVVVLALAVWGALWGVAGAVLAIPLTSVLMILLSVFVGGRRVAALMTADGRVSGVGERRREEF
ncbi:AI-2E family transporter [Neomegalonema perideroedes]|uniref:AI-2E family transporter n=1 Tax=Neomegalonema perideroedes TaxID=217219 RepID=UPI00037EDBD9|nr:AI-2E family transporter [Neomegalonema perideroedes]